MRKIPSTHAKKAVLSYYRSAVLLFTIFWNRGVPSHCCALCCRGVRGSLCKFTVLDMNIQKIKPKNQAKDFTSLVVPRTRLFCAQVLLCRLGFVSAAGWFVLLGNTIHISGTVTSALESSAETNITSNCVSIWLALLLHCSRCPGAVS